MNELAEARKWLRFLLDTVRETRAAVGLADVEQVTVFPLELCPERLGCFMRRFENGLAELVEVMGG